MLTYKEYNITVVIPEGETKVFADTPVMIDSYDMTTEELKQALSQ